MFFALEALILTNPVRDGLRATTELPSAERTAMIVNADRVSQEEFVWFMEQERPRVVEHIRTTYHLEYTNNFWTRSCDGDTSRTLLRRNTVSRLVREKVEQALFLELGMVKDIRYSACLRQLEHVNRERQQAVRLGQVVYGPVTYSQLQYYGHWKATLKIQAKEKLAQDRFTITEGKLKAFYERNRGRWKSEETFDLEIAAVENPGVLGDKRTAPATKSIVQTILSRLEAGQSMSQATTGYEAEAKISIRRFDEIDAGRIGELFSSSDALRTVLSLTMGQNSVVTNSASCVRIVRCIGKVPQTILPYEKVKEAVSTAYLEQQYDCLLNELASKAKVVTNEQLVNSLLP